MRSYSSRGTISRAHLLAPHFFRLEGSTFILVDTSRRSHSSQHNDSQHGEHKDGEGSNKKQGEDGDEHQDENEGSYDVFDASNLSDSFCQDSISSIDMAEKREQEVRHSLLFAILSACGIMFVMKIIKLIISKCAGGHNGGADHAATDAAGHAGDDAVLAHRGMESAMWASSQNINYAPAA